MPLPKRRVEMTRLEKFHSLKDHPWYHRIYSKIPESDIAQIETWIKIRERCTAFEFECWINRLYIDNADKPKRWKEILDLLTASNVR